MFMLPLYPLYRCGCDPPVLFVRAIVLAALSPPQFLFAEDVGKNL
jgi:hypothetical protein